MIYPLFAKLHEFLITEPKTVSLDIADKLYQYHILPMDAVRKTMNIWVTASSKSGHRPKWWEFKKKRDGTSQHTFIDEWKNGSGAIDWTCEDFQKNKDEFLRLIIKHTKYTRIAIYENFIHCDYKHTVSGAREIYKINSNSKWELIKTV